MDFKFLQLSLRCHLGVGRLFVAVALMKSLFHAFIFAPNLLIFFLKEIKLLLVDYLRFTIATVLLLLDFLMFTLY